MVGVGGGVEGDVECVPEAAPEGLSPGETVAVDLNWPALVFGCFFRLPLPAAIDATLGAPCVALSPSRRRGGVGLRVVEPELRESSNGEGGCGGWRGRGK